MYGDANASLRANITIRVQRWTVVDRPISWFWLVEPKFNEVTWLNLDCTMVP
jgi:hypothetical protein